MGAASSRPVCNMASQFSDDRGRVMYNVMYIGRRREMTQMIRKQIYIRKQQQALLKRLAKARGVSEAEVIRQAIDEQMGGVESRPMPLDSAAWEKAHRFMLTLRAEGPVADRPREWTREELYEERLNRDGQRVD